MRYLVFILCLFLFSCGIFEHEEVSEAENLPLLKARNAVGFIAGFEIDYPVTTRDSISSARMDLVNAGLSASRLQIDWPELEISEGVYNQKLLEDELLANSLGNLQPFLTLSVFDSDGPVLPQYLQDVEMDDEQLISRFNKLMDWVIPTLKEFNGWGIAISNEPDNFFEEDKTLDEKMVRFTRNARIHIHDIDPAFAVGITMNLENLKHSRRSMKKLLKECDFLSMNLYGSGLFPLDMPYTSKENAKNFDNLLDFADRKQIVIQELGMHSDMLELNSSEEIQSAFFEQFFEFMQEEDQVRAAFQFTLVDWSEELVNIFEASFDEETPDWFVGQFLSVLKGIGLMDYETGRRKKSYFTFMQWVERLND